jgi:hypothetical protein
MTDKPRERGVRIPLSFTDAVRGLLAIDPKQLPSNKAKAKRGKAKPKAKRPQAKK